MEQVDLRGANCRQARFSELKNCVLDNVDATGSSFTLLDGCRLTHANLTGSSIGGRSSGCDFSHAILRSARLGYRMLAYVKDYARNCFDDADLSGVDAAGAYLPHTSFQRARIAGARLSRADLSHCDLRNADATGANLVRTRLTGVVTSCTLLEGSIVSPEDAKALGAADPGSTPHFVLARGAPMPLIADMTRELNQSSEYRIDWQFYSTASRPGQSILISQTTIEDGPRGYSFDLDNQEFIRMYPMDEAPNSLLSILPDLAADYADWRPNIQSLRIQCGRSTRPGRRNPRRLGRNQRYRTARRILNELLNELFANS